MIRYFKIVEGEYIQFIGTGDFLGETISEEEYNSIYSIIQNKPADTETHYYMLRADTPEYEAIEVRKGNITMA